MAAIYIMKQIRGKADVKNIAIMLRSCRGPSW